MRILADDWVVFFLSHHLSRGISEIHEKGVISESGKIDASTFLSCCVKRGPQSNVG